MAGQDNQELVDKIVSKLQEMEIFLAESGISVAEEDPKYSTGWLKSAYQNSVYKSYLIYLQEKEVIDRYLEFLEEENEYVDKEDRESPRNATEKHKEQLQDSCIAFEARKCEIHHIIPHRYGGKTEVSNLAPLCSQCHKLVEAYEHKFAEESFIQSFRQGNSQATSKQLDLTEI